MQYRQEAELGECYYLSFVRHPIVRIAQNQITTRPVRRGEHLPGGSDGRARSPSDGAARSAAPGRSCHRALFTSQSAEGFAVQILPEPYCSDPKSLSLGRATGVCAISLRSFASCSDATKIIRDPV